MSPTHNGSSTPECSNVSEIHNRILFDCHIIHLHKRLKKIGPAQRKLASTLYKCDQALFLILRRRLHSSYLYTVDREIFVGGLQRRKLDARKFFNDKVRIALVGYMKPVRGLPDQRRLFFFSHVTNSIRVCLAPCVAYTYQQLSRKLIFGAFNFQRI